MNDFLRDLAFRVGAVFFVFYQIIYSLLMIFIPRQFRKKKDIAGQIILITGAGSGVGRELAIEFAEYLVCLILVDINEEALLETKKIIENHSKVFTYVCDVSDSKMVYKMAKKIKDEVGDVDILVNNAGIVQGKYLMELSDENIRKTMDVNAISHFWTCKAFLPAMIAKNRGHIVSIASIAGQQTASRLTDYCASKFAAIGFADALEVELQERNIKGIKITIVCPSHINTSLFAGVRLTVTPQMTPSYVAREVVHSVLVEDESLYLPGWLSFAIVIKQIIPRWASIELLKISGDISCMSKFKGEETAQNGNGVINCMNKFTEGEITENGKNDNKSK